MAEDFEPHIHICELQLIWSNWKKKCPYKGKLSDSETECDCCEHFVTINFYDNEMTKIKNIERDNS
jgi:hypothetical protein